MVTQKMISAKRGPTKKSPIKKTPIKKTSDRPTSSTLKSPRPKATSYRPSWDETCMNIIKEVARRPTCIYLKVACLFLTSDHNVAGIGYNGSPRGVIHCSDAGCVKDLGGACRGAHAEINAISNCLGAPRQFLAGSTLYTTVLPCNQCMKQLTQIGVKRIVFEKFYIRRPELDEKRSIVERLIERGYATLSSESANSIEQAKAAGMIVEQYNRRTKKTKRIA